ncbi:MAG: two-component system sensor histidine kinase CreC [Desulfobacterales bacterium]
MKLGSRIFFSFMLILMLSFAYPINYALDSLRVRYLEGVEDPLVDQAHILAALAAREFKPSQIDPDTGQLAAPNLTRWAEALTYAHDRPLAARIYNLEKVRVDLQIYITNAAGRVLYDSQDPQRVGSDFSRWRDVHLTLKGQYGARTTQSDPEIPESSVLHVAAPIEVDGTVVGVLTVVKPTTNINNFLKEAKPHIFQAGLFSGLGAILAGLLLTFWWTRPINRLIHYAEAVGQGRRVAFPRLDQTEIGALGRAFQRMQAALEGKQYVEHYVQNLTHELKSPLTAIRGAAELMGEPRISPAQHQRFLHNIQRETGRIQQIVDRMLALAALENQNLLQKKKPVTLEALIPTALEGLQSRIAQAKLKVQVDLEGDAVILGDAFLLHQALTNLLQNAVEFSPPQGELRVQARIVEGQLELEILDQGPGIPEYALPRIFDKFYSLRRPTDGLKSTGLGLNFVREIAALHGGSVTVANHPTRGGVRACLTLPLSS